MNLSNILFSNISNKLKFLTNKKNFYIKNLFNQIYHLEQIKKKKIIKNLAQK